MCAKEFKSGQKSSSRRRSFARFRRKAERTAENVADQTIGHIEENIIDRIDKFHDIRLLVLEWILMVFAIIVLALLQSFWFRDSYSTTAFVSGGSFIEGGLGQINSLNPLFASTSSEKTLSRLLFSTLTTSDYSGHIGSGLARSVTAEEGGKTWRVRLRDGLKWSDGESITPDDVVFTVNLIKNPKISTSYSSNLQGVSAYKAEDNSVIFSLPSAFADFSAALTIPILPQHLLADVDPALLLETDFSISPVSSGSFCYNATQITNGESVVYLSPNEHYYNGKPMLSSFAVHAFDSEAEIIASLNSGAITATAELSPSSADQVTNPSIYEKQTSIMSGVYLFFNTTSDIFKSRTVRQAVRQGLDLPTLRAETLNDEPPLDYPILASQIELGNWPALPAHDETAATIALAQYADQPISLATIDTDYFPELAEGIKAQLETLGLNVELEIYQPGQEFMSSVISGRNYDLLLYEIELGADPDLFAYYHSSQIGATGLNLSNYNDAITDRLIISARASLDEATRKSLYEAFLTRWVENVPAIGIYQVNISYFLSRNVRAFSEDNTLIYPTDRFADIEIWSAVKTDRYRTP